MISELNEIMLHIRSFPYTDRIVFYTTLFNKVNIHGDNLRDLLIESYIADDNYFIYLENLILMFITMLIRRLNALNNYISASLPLLFVT